MTRPRRSSASSCPRGSDTASAPGQKKRPTTAASWTTCFSSGRQPVEAGGKERLDRVGERDAGRGARRHPSVLVAGDRALVDEPAQELLDEERVALGAGDDFAAELRRQLVDMEQPFDELAALGIGQWSEGDGGGVRVGGEAGVRLREFRPRGEHEQDRALGARRDVRQEGEHLVVRPVKVFDHEQRWSLPRQAGGKARPGAGHRLGDLARRASVRSALPGTDSRGQRHRLHRLGHLGLRQAERAKDLAHPFADACAGGLVAVRGRGAGRVAKPLGKRPEGDPLPGRQAAAAQHRHRRGVPVDPRDELPQEPALPDARIAVDRHEPWPLRLDRLIEQAAEEVELAVTADHRRLEAGHAALRLGKWPHQASRDHRRRLALQVEALLVAEGEGMARGEVGARADDDLARLGGGLEAGCHVHDVARDEQLPRGRRVPVRPERGHDLPGVQADPDLHRHPESLGELRVQRPQSLEHLSAALQARCASSSWAVGMPKTAMIASPMYFSTVPFHAPMTADIAPEIALERRRAAAPRRAAPRARWSR